MTPGAHHAQPNARNPSRLNGAFRVRGHVSTSSCARENGGFKCGAISRAAAAVLPVLPRPTATEAPPCARRQQRSPTSIHPTGSFAAATTLGCSGGRPKQRRRWYLCPTGTRAPAPTAAPRSARPRRRAIENKPSNRHRARLTSRVNTHIDVRTQFADATSVEWSFSTTPLPRRQRHTPPRPPTGTRSPAPTAISPWCRGAS